MLEFLTERMEVHRSATAEFRGDGPHAGKAGGRRPGGFHGGRGGPGDALGVRIEKLIEELDLSEEQGSQIRDALQEMRKAMQALRSQYSPVEGAREGLREKVEEIREQFAAKLKAILDAEQLERLEELRAERRSDIAEKREINQQQRIERRVDFLTKVLDMNDSQKQEVSGFLTDAAEQARALYQKERNEEISREDLRDELHSIQEGSMAAIRGVLTPGQAEVFDALKELVPGHGRPRRR
jgi:chromosome segregation ATPase